MAAAPETRGETIRGWARWYDSLVGVLTLGREAALRGRILDAAGLAPGDRVLDLGCGTGTLALGAAARVGPEGEVQGVDASPEMIDVARGKAAGAGAGAPEFQVALAEQLPFAEGRFDVAMSTLVFHHLPGDLQRAALAEMRRVLRPGGALLLVDFRSTSHSFLGHLASMVGHRHGHSHAADSASGSLAELVGEAGFEAVEELDEKPRAMAWVRARA